MAARREEKVRENLLRRMAQRQGLVLRKSRRRDPFAKDYGLYWVIDPELRELRGKWPAGQYPARGFPSSGADLDVVEDYLTTPRQIRERTPPE